ncbi:MAG: flavin reductase family protein [Brevinematia bacterium]
MLKESKKNKFYHFYPNIVCVVVSGFENKVNAMPVAWSSGISSNPRYFGVMIAKKRFTYKLIQKSNKFSVNFLDWKYLDIVVKLGSTSGETTDKIREFNIPIEKGKSENMFFIPLSYAVYECKVIKDDEIGDHNLIIGEIERVLIDETVFDDDEKPILKKIKPIFYMGSGEFVKLEVSDSFKEK